MYDISKVTTANTFQYQVDGYSTIKWFKTARGKAVIELVVWVFLTPSSLSLLLLPLMWFVHKGNRAIMVFLIIFVPFLALIAVVKYLELYQSVMPFVIITIFCADTARHLYHAQKIEALRKSATLPSDTDPQARPISGC